MLTGDFERLARDPDIARAPRPAEDPIDLGSLPGPELDPYFDLDFGM